MNILDQAILKRTIVFSLAIVFSLPFSVLARDYDFYVDADNDTGTEDGTEAHPYNTINEAVTAATANDEDDRKIYVAEGDYREQIELEDGMELYGEDNDDVVILGRDSDGDDYSYGIKMNDGCKIKDLTVKYGDYGVYVDDNAEVEIEDCKIKDSEDVGIKVEDGEDRSDKYLFKMEDTKVYKSDGKGLEIEKRKVDIRDCEIYENEEEGIDFRSKVKGKIYDNEVRDNGESGIELEMKSANLKLKDNKLEDNDASGLVLQYREGYQKYQTSNGIELDGNDLEGNDSYGLRCSRPNGGIPSFDFYSSAVTFDGDAFSDNDLGNFSSLCNFL